MVWISSRGVPHYDEDDPPFQPRRKIPPGLGVSAGTVLGREAGEGLPPGWMTTRPPCADSDPEVFFPGKGDNYGAALARRICSLCPMIAECREHNLDERHGIWGGTSEKDRRILRARRDRRQKTYNPLLD